jgi:uncharacterized membrane protein YidH (DUF202 family)
MSRDRDPGLAFERTTLAWHRTGLSALALSALAVHSFQERMRVAVPIAGLLAVIGVLAYRTGATSPVPPRRLRMLSLGVSGAALLCALATFSG